MPERIDLSVGEWRRVSPKYVLVVIASTVITGLVLSAASLFLWLVGGWAFGWIALAVVVIVTLVALIIAPRRARSIGYRLRDDDLLFRRGIMFQRFVSVPYGRMQLIDITRGPVGRMLGLAEVGTRSEPGLRAVVLSLEESYDLDSTALDALIEFDRAMARAGFRVQLARLHDRARDLIGIVHVALHQLDLADGPHRRQVVGEVGIAHRHADAITGLRQRAHGVAPDKARTAKNRDQGCHDESSARRGVR